MRVRVRVCARVRTCMFVERVSVLVQTSNYTGEEYVVLGLLVLRVWPGGLKTQLL